MGTISFRKIAKFMDPVRPADRMGGSDQHDYDKSDEDRWLHGGARAKRRAADFGLYHSKSKGLFQMHQGNPNSFREIGERHISSKSQHHKILVYNTYLLKYKMFKSAPDRVQRSKEIGRIIERDNYDIACLCEVFDSSDCKRIKKGLNDSGGKWAEAFGPDSSGIHVSGGLYGVIKEKGHRRLSSTLNEEFEDGGEGYDEFSNKGWLLMEVDLGPGTIDIFLTHTDADRDKNDIESRKTQITELTDFIKQRQKDYPEHITMAVGDFNVYSSFPEYTWFLNHMWENCSMRDVWLTRGGKAGATHAFSSKCTISGSPDCACDDYNSGDYGGDRLDYIFIQEPKPEHTMNLDMSRIKRKPFPRDKPCGVLNPIELINDFLLGILNSRPMGWKPPSIDHGYEPPSMNSGVGSKKTGSDKEAKDHDFISTFLSEERNLKSQDLDLILRFLKKDSTLTLRDYDRIIKALRLKSLNYLSNHLGLHLEVLSSPRNTN